MAAGLRYSHTMCFTTFPFPESADSKLADIGEEFYFVRHSIMNSRNIGLTQLLNLVNDQYENSADIVSFRNLIISLDKAVAMAYGWNDLDLNHGFHQPVYLPENAKLRFGLHPEIHLEVLRRLESINQKIFEEEQAMQQLPSKAKPKAAKAPRASAKAAPPASLFDPPQAAGLVPEEAKQAVLEILRRGNRWFKKAEVLRESRVSEGEWNQVIAGLVADGTVERRGVKRGTEYMLRR